ncbi:SemiSWEET transporter [Paradesertivirga mongoliensis]|uniref:SemiSWEET transporter n=1 Tax=Paradesertivirga mongoliensis TaxID=2100740 RepID=A0ABW4ZRG8_9SPHI|nr:SemiSWEET transporter [Pedobacter mongoliensis]
MKISNEIIGLAAGILTATAMIPQVVKTIKEKNAENISPFMVIILIIGTATWTYYGTLKDDMPIIVTNAFSCLVNCLMLFCKLRFSKT